MRVIWFVFLSVLAGIDLWNRKLPVFLLWAFGLVGFGGMAWEMSQALGRHGWGRAVAVILAGVLASMAVGALLLVFSCVTRGALGAGDGWFFLITGCYLPWEKNLGLLCYSLLIGSLYGIGVFIWGVIRKEEVKGKRIPFLPFVWVAVLLLKGVIQ